MDSGSIRSHWEYHSSVRNGFRFISPSLRGPLLRSEMKSGSIVRHCEDRLAVRSNLSLSFPISNLSFILNNTISESVFRIVLKTYHYASKNISQCRYRYLCRYGDHRSQRVTLPVKNAREAAIVIGLKVYGMEKIADVVDFFNRVRSLILWRLPLLRYSIIRRKNMTLIFQMHEVRKM